MNKGLQALRGIAATLVFLHHVAWPPRDVLKVGVGLDGYELGLAGVLVFFALSGYLMTYKDHRAAKTFAVDRLRRLFPGYWAGLLLGAFIDWVARGVPFHVDPRLWVLYPSGGFVYTPVPYWTLVFELGFYAVVFAAICIARSRSWIVVLTCLAISYLLFERPYEWSKDAYPGWTGLAFSWFSLFFLIGAAVARIPLPKGRWVAPAFAAVGVSLFVAQHNRWLTPWLGPLEFDGSIPTIELAVSVGLILAAALSWRAEGRIGTALARIGDASYGIYLTHIGFLFLMSTVLARTSALVGLPDWLVIACVGVPAFALSYAFGVSEWLVQKSLKFAIDSLRAISLPSSSLILQSMFFRTRETKRNMSDQARRTPAPAPHT